MKCFYHADKEAVALCKSCSRALCHDCSADVNSGTACVNRCESEVAAVNLVIERSKTAYQKTGGAYKRSGLWLLAMGLLFVAIGLLPILMGTGNYGSGFLSVMGLFFVVGAMFNFKSGREISATAQTPEQDLGDQSSL